MYMNMAFDNICFKGSAVSTSARFVYLCLCKHADNTKQTCFPSLNRIAQIVGKSVSTIKRAVRELCKYGVILRTPRFRKDGGQTSNLYTIVEGELDLLTKVPENIESHTELKIPDQDISTDDIFFSESDHENEPASSCTSEAGETKQSKEVEELKESINLEMENTSLSRSSNATAETEKIHIDDKPEQQQQENDTAILHMTPIRQIIKNENAGITAEQVTTSKASGIKEKVCRFFKCIS